MGRVKRQPVAGLGARVLAGLLVQLLLLGAAVEGSLWFANRDSNQQARLAALAYAGELRSRAERELNAVLFLVAGLDGYLEVRKGQPDQAELSLLLDVLYRKSRYILSLVVAEGTRIAYVHPPASGRRMLNVDYRDLPDQWPLVQRMMADAKPALTRPITLLQGGRGIVYREPVMVDGQYWGLVSTAINIELLLATAFADLGRQLPYAIGVSEPGQGEMLLAGTAELLTSPTVVAVSNERQWRFVVDYRAFLQPSPWPWLARGLGWLAALVLTMLTAVVVRQRQALATMALTDALTGLPNRHLFEDRLQLALQRRLRRSDGQVCLLLLDVDGFKQINDRFGHHVGDRVLCTMAERLKGAARSEDTVARWAGDEFVVIVEDGKDLDPQLLMNRLRQHCELPLLHDGQQLAVGLSMGAALCPADGLSGEQLFTLADQRMYDNKRLRQQGSDGRV